MIGNTHDARTPYTWAKRYAAQLGNTRLLTYVADRHAALVDFNRCVFTHTIDYVTDLELPAPGSTCTQEYPAFPSPADRSKPKLPWLLPSAR